MDLARLNINECGQPVRRAPPSDAEVEAFEAAFGIRLPTRLLELLRFSNGGHPELDSYEPSDPESENGIGLDHFYFLNRDKESSRSLWKAMEVWQPYIGQHGLPFAEDGGGNVLFLDSSEEPPPVRVCWPSENFKTGKVAQSFEILIAALAADPDYI
jgi:SMI1 / KNR4 family (SUKH-1)